MGHCIDDYLNPRLSCREVPHSGCDHADSRDVDHAGDRSRKVQYVRLEIRVDALYKLINSRVLVVEDVRKLDVQAQRYVRQFLLDTLRGQ